MRSLTELYTELRTPVFRFLFRLGGDADLAEELTQETFVQALLALPRFRGDSGVRTWLFGIARNVYLKRMRQEARRRGPPAGGDRASPAWPAPPAWPQAPPEAAEAAQARAWLAEALAALPEPQRTALVLREYEELPFAEVGAIMGRTEVWARVTCFRARQQLREHYLRLSGGERP